MTAVGFAVLRMPARDWKTAQVRLVMCAMEWTPAKERASTKWSKYFWTDSCFCLEN